MFPDFGSLEILLILVVTLLVIGPEKLPETLRALGLWFGRLSRSFNSVKSEIEKENWYGRRASAIAQRGGDARNEAHRRRGKGRYRPGHPTREH